MKTFDDWLSETLKKDMHAIWCEGDAYAGWNASREATIDEVLEIIHSLDIEDNWLDRIKALRGKQ